MSVIIRPMTPGDLDAAKRVILGVAAGLFEPDSREPFIERWWTQLTDVDDWQHVYGPPRGVFLVALAGDRLIGTGAIRPYDEETAELKRMWLLEAYHGRGIGYRLITELLAFARAAGYGRVWLSTDDTKQHRAVRFYERLGFQPIAPYNDSDDTLFMGLALEPERSGQSIGTNETMTKTYLNPPALFNSQQYGFSQVVVAEGRRTVYCSGQVAWDEAEEIGSADLGQQTRRALANVARAVEAAGGSLADVVSLRIYIVGDHIRNTAAVREALLETFDAAAQPASTWLGVAALANPDFAIEIEAIAVLE